MTKNELERRARLMATLTGLGFTEPEVESLRRISNTLRRWHELECGINNGMVERDENGKPIWRASSGRSWPMRDYEKGALKRLETIITTRNKRFTVKDNAPMLFHYIQTAPRGAALYILRPQDVMAGSGPHAFYSNGICVF
jgi:hypothetical protein